MNLPDNLILGGAMMALVSVLMAVMVIYLGNREEQKQAAQHPRPADPENHPNGSQSANADAVPYPPGDLQGVRGNPGTDLHLQLTIRGKDIKAIIVSLQKP